MVRTSCQWSSGRLDANVEPTIEQERDWYASDWTQGDSRTWRFCPYCGRPVDFEDAES